MRRSFLFAIALLCGQLCAGGCHEEALSPVPHTVVIERDGYSVRVETTSLTLDLLRGDEVLTTMDGASLVLGSVDQVDDAISYDPYPLVAKTEGYLAPTGTAFHPAKSVSKVEATDDVITLDVVHEGGGQSRVEIRAQAEGSFRLSIVPTEPTTVAWIRVGARTDDVEAFYGLGEHFDDVNQRGKLRAMQLEIDELESANNEAHVPVPLLIGTAGWGMFVESDYPGVFDVASTSSDRVEATFGLGSAAASGLVVHLLAAPHPLDVTQRYYELTGYPRLPAPWALGPLVWRDENESQAQVEQDLDTMRELDLATNGIWIDRPYATGVNTFDFDPAKFSDPAAMIDKAHGLGFRVSLWHVPYLDDGDEATAALVQEAEDEGYYPPEIGITLNQWGDPIDFTAPGAVEWWQGLLDPYIALGIEGFKLDYGEDLVPRTLGVARNVYEFSDGTDERTMHRGYTLLYHQTYADLLPDDGGFLLCRAGKWGDQVHGPIIWPGDLDARFWKHREEVTEGGETFLAVGGLHASMVAGLTLGPSGFPFYGADTGGYRHSPPDRELFRRWFEQTALSSVMQIGTSTNDVAWEFDDPELLDSYRKYTRLHLRLFPYAWTFAKEIARTGRPLQRPFGLQEPALGEHPSDQYFFGDALLVAPVTEAGATQRDLFLGDGEWVGFWDGLLVEGPGEITISAVLGTLPLFIRRGALLPLLRPTIDTLAPTTQPALVDSFATSAGPLYVIVSAGAASTFAVYDGTILSQRIGDESGAPLLLTFEAGTVFTFGAVFEAIAFGPAPPSRVLVDTTTLEPAADLASLASLGQGYVFDPLDRGGTLSVKIAPGDGALRVRIER